MSTGRSRRRAPLAGSNSGGWAALMNYEEMSDEELQLLLTETAPQVHVEEVTDCNRETVIAFLKLLIGEPK
jgi:hypothetical protein